MKKNLIIFALLIFTTSQAFSIDFFNGTYNEALEKAQKENKNLLLYFTATWCGPCQYMQKYVFPSLALTSYVNTKFVALKLDIDTKEGKLIYEKVHRPKGPRGVPAYVIINSKEEILKKAVGGMKENGFQEFISTDPSEKILYLALADSIAEKQLDKTKKIKGNFGKFILDNRYSKWKPGVTLGTNLMGYKGSHHNHEVSVGYEVGVLFSREFDSKEERIPFWHKSRYDFQVSLSLTSKGGTLQKDGRINVNIHYLQLGVPNNYAIRGFHRIQISINPYAALALCGNSRSDVAKRKILFDEELDNKDFGLRLGISKNYGSFKPYFGYDLGLNDIQSGGDKAYNRGFYFSAALIFR